MQFGIPQQLVSLGVCLLFAVTPTSAADPSPESAAIRQVLDAQSKAWNKGDLKGFMQGYWQSKDLSFYSGNDKTQGWQATLDRYQKRYQSDGKVMGQLTFSEMEVDLLGNESAVVRGRWKVVDGEVVKRGLYTLIMRKMPEGWRIVHDHTSSE